MTDFFANYGQYIFIVFLLLIVGLVFTFVFTRRGKNGGVELIFGCKVLEDLGEIGRSSLPLGSQKLRLLKCQSNDGELFAVIEVANSFVASYNVTWIKVDSDILKNLNHLVSP